MSLRPVSRNNWQNHFIIQVLVAGNAAAVVLNKYQDMTVPDVPPRSFDKPALLYLINKQC